MQQYCLRIPIEKYPTEAFLVPKLKFFILQQTLHLNKFESVDFKYDNGFFEFQPENTQMKHCLSSM